MGTAGGTVPTGGGAQRRGATFYRRVTTWVGTGTVGPSTLATLFNHMWPRIVADPSTLGRHVCYACKRSVCGGDEPQPVAHLSHKLQCARQSLKIMISYGNKYPCHNARPHVVEQSGQCARALKQDITQLQAPSETWQMQRSSTY